MTAISVNAVGAGQGWTEAGAPAEGLELVVFDGAPRVLAEKRGHDAQAVSWSTTSSTEVERLTSRETAVVFAVRPLAPGTTNPALIRTDQLEVIVAWRRP
jgi:hypothetical protein